MNLGRRVATALVALPVVLAINFAGPPWLTVLAVGLAVGIGLFELFALLRAGGLRPFVAVGVAAALALFGELVWPDRVPVPTAPFIVLVVLAAALTSATRREDTVPGAAATLLAALYLGGLGGTLAALRVMAPLEAGSWRLCLLLAIAILADTFAYFVGSSMGRHKLAPLVSPNKTVEGLLGGLAGGVLAAWAVCSFGLPELPLGPALALGLLTAASGTVGDLAESLLKRWAGVKDSGTLFPGHGGMLDRLDSLLFGAPVLYYYFLYFA
jgi:phosphatidate cytidylyltransferase